MLPECSRFPLSRRSLLTASLASLALLAPRLDRSLRAYALLALGGIGFAYVLAQGFAIGSQGWSFDALASALTVVA